MAWLSNLLTTKKGNELKPIFGQPFLNTYGFDDKHQGLYYTDAANIKINSVEKSVELSVGVIENCSDSDSISTVLGISKVEFLKLIASNNSRINDILKFLYNNGDKLCLLCSIYIVTEDATLNNKATKYGIRNISKLLLGHHIILCIPLKERLNMIDEAKENVMMLLTKKHNGHLPEYLMNDAAILIDYKEIMQKQAFEMLDELNTWQFSNKVASLFAEMPEQRFPINYSYFNDSLAIATILKLKKFIFLNEEKFLFYSNYHREKKPLIWNKIADLAGDIKSNIREIYNMDFSTFPPPPLKILYDLCKVYETEYYYAVNDLTLLPNVQQFLYHNLETVFNFVKALPFHKLENAWIIEANDENSKEIYSIYLARKICILYTKNTKHLVTEFFNESIIWLLSEETKWDNATEPVLIHDQKIGFLLGMITPTNCNKQTCKNGKLYLARCSCNNDKDAKAWICTKCKVLLRCGDNGFAYCDCGVFREESLFKKCFKCFQKELETPSNSTEEQIKDSFLTYHSSHFEGQKLPLAPTTPPTPTASPTPTLMTKTVEIAPKKISPIKNNFNILFIGQSGAGKSMLVNSIYNYLKYDFEKVSKAETVDCILPCQFQLQTPDFKKLVFKASPVDENENFNDSGESVTQHPKVYSFKTEKYDCQVIDTPGLGDTRGAKQDEYTLNLIRNAIIEIKELHSICFVIPSSIKHLSATFEGHMRDLLSLFPKTALKNVFFFFTYANSTFFNIGDTRNTLEEFISTFKETNNAEIPFGAENVYCVDSEAFMYFIATNQGHKYQNRDLESFRVSWNKSKAAVETFLVKVENVKPIKSDDLLMTYELEQIGTMLRKEKDPKLAELIEIILTKISQISMSSNVLSVKKRNVQTVGEFKKNELFQALEICQEHVIDLNLKQFIQKLVEAYGEKTAVKNANKMEQINGGNIKKRSSIENDKVLKNGTEPDPPRRMQNDWPCIKRLKEIADKLGKEWQNGNISRNLMEHMLNVQIARNSQADVQKQKLKDSLDFILMDVNGELYDMITEFIDGNESTETNVTKSIETFADKFADEMRHKNLSRTLCEEFIEFQMAKNCKLEDLQIEPLLDALTSTEITLLPGNIFKRDIQNLRTLLEEEQQRRMPKIKNVEITVGTKTVFSNQIQENTNLQKYLHLNNKYDELVLKVIINSTTNIADIFLPESKTVILHLSVNWDETFNFDILPLFNVITISTYKVVTYIPLTDDCTSFLSSIDYGGTTPKIGVENESPTVVKDLITVLGLTEIPKNASKTMAVYALRGFPELIYFIQTNQRTHFVNPETAVSELLKEASKNIDKSNILLTIPRSFNDIQKVAYSKAAEYANLTNIKFVDEIISLAYGYELIHEIADNKVYLLVYYFYPNFIVSIFKSGIIKEKEISTIQVEFEDFKEWEQTFFDSIINEALESDDRIKNSSNKIDQLFKKTTEEHQQFDFIVVALKNGTLLSKMFADNFPNIAVTTINDQETYIARGANIALHSSMVSN